MDAMRKRDGCEGRAVRKKWMLGRADDQWLLLITDGGLKLEHEEEYCVHLSKCVSVLFSEKVDEVSIEQVTARQVGVRMEQCRGRGSVSERNSCA
jgi:hypothetical protein